MGMSQVNRVRARIAILWLYKLLKTPEWAWLRETDENFQRNAGSIEAAINNERYGMTREHMRNRVHPLHFLRQLNESVSLVTLPLSKSQTYPDTRCFEDDWALEMGLNILRFWMFENQIHQAWLTNASRNAGQVASQLGLGAADIRDLLEYLFTCHIRKELAW